MNGKFDHELIMSENQYERTGRQIRVPEDELVEIVLDRIDHYLTLHPRDRRNYPNPRTDPVVTRIASGKTIEIPQKLVDKALEIHSACGTVGTVERMKSVGNSNTNSAHTRLAKRDRYAGSDPHIMDKDLRGKNLVGFDGQVAGDATYNDYPQRYNEFNQRMNGQISKSRNASDLNDIGDPLNSYSHERLDRCDAKKKDSVGQFRIGQRMGSKKNMAHNNGPSANGAANNSANADYMDGVDSMLSDISPEGDSALVYAPLDEDEDLKSNTQQLETVDQRPVPSMGPAINMDDYDNEPDYNCKSCGHNDGYRSNNPYHPEGHEYEEVNGEYDNLDHRDYDDEVLYDPANNSDNSERRENFNALYSNGPGVDKHGFYIDDEDFYNDDDGKNKDSDAVEGYRNNRNNRNSSTNNGMYLLLIALLVVLYINYQKQ
jgi:hypothetical protein